MDQAFFRGWVSFTSSRAFSSRLPIVNGVFFRQHPPMQYPGNQNASGIAPEKHDVSAMFHAAQAGPDAIAGTAGVRVIGEPPATCFQFIKVADGLSCAPLAQSPGADAHQVGLGKTREPECGQWR